METKKFKVTGNNGVNGNKPKGGKNNTQTILTAGGILGAAAAGYASGAFHEEENQEEEQHEEQTENTSTQQDTAQQTEQHTEQEQHVEEHQSEELQPIVDEHVDLNDNQQSVDDVNPDEVAQQIAQANEIDNNDNESADMLNVDGLTTAMGPDGQEYVVAIVHTPDGGEFMLADTDGDGVFSDVFDMEGNYVGAAEGDLTASDLEEMADPSGGYLAMADDEPMGDDPTADIVNTTGETSEEHDLADNEDGDGEMTDDELLAQLLDDNDSDDEVADHVYEEGGDEDDADIAVDESDNDSEDIAEADSDDVDDSADDDDLTA